MVILETGIFFPKGEQVLIFFPKGEQAVGTLGYIIIIGQIITWTNMKKYSAKALSPISTWPLSSVRKFSSPSSDRTLA